MTGFLPIVDILAGLETDSERASWLLAVSDGVVLRDFESIRVVLLQSRFRIGVACLNVRFTALHAVRTQNGDLPAAVAELFERTQSVLRAVASGQFPDGEVLQ